GSAEPRISAAPRAISHHRTGTGLANSPGGYRAMPMPTPADAPAPRQRARARAVRRLARVGLVLVGLLMVGLGCQTPEDRYRVLSFFFDGVPVPPGMLGDMPELAEGGPEAQRRAQ